jgi:putative ABC transport system substrate-binding protein
MTVTIGRRELLAALGGAAAAWPLAASAQQPARIRRIGVLLPRPRTMPTHAWVGAFRQALAQSGWIIGRNVRIDARWAGSKAEDIR